MNRLEKKIAESKIAKRKLFIAFITAGDPNLGTTKKLVSELYSSGVDIVELGVPFSDPLADGQIIQEASVRALNNEVNLVKIFSLIKDMRKTLDIPIVLMGYFNPIYRYGMRNFVIHAKKSGADGVIVADLPPEEADELILESRKRDFSTIFLVAPTSSVRRIKEITKVSEPFIYYVSLTGITGDRLKLTQDVRKKVQLIKRFTDSPVCVGFGVSSRQHIKELLKFADGVVVGSAIVRIIGAEFSKQKMLKKVSAFVKELSKAFDRS